MRYRFELDGKARAEQLFREMSPAIEKRISKAVGSGLAMVARHHKTKEIRRGGGPSVLHRWTVRTGEATRSFKIDFRKGDLEGSYYSDLRRMEKLEEGGDITPKRAKFLAIPIHDEVKFGRGPGKSPRHVPGLFFLQSLRGQPMLVRPTGGTGFEVMYLLRRKVTLPPRRTVQRTMKKMEPKVLAKVDAAIEEGANDAAK